MKFDELCYYVLEGIQTKTHFKVPENVEIGNIDYDKLGVKHPGVQAFFNKVLDIIKNKPGVGANDVAFILGKDSAAVRPRIKQLVQMGLLITSDRITDVARGETSDLKDVAKDVAAAVKEMDIKEVLEKEMDATREKGSTIEDLQRALATSGITRKYRSIKDVVLTVRTIIDKMLKKGTVEEREGRFFLKGETDPEGVADVLDPNEIGYDEHDPDVEAAYREYQGGGVGKQYEFED